MATANLICRIVLASVFVVAAGSKLADLAGTRAAVVEFGAPRRLAGAVTAVLVAAELAVAALLLPSSTAAVGAFGAVLLLAVFSAAVIVSLARGRAPECHCFGQLHSAPASWKTLVRNAVLAGIAAVVLASSLSGHSPSAVSWVAGLDSAEAVGLGAALAVAGLVAAGSVVFVTLLRSYGKVLVRLDRLERVLAANGIAFDEEEPELGLPPGTPVPELPGIGGLLEARLPVLLVFASPRCPSCRTLLQKAADWQVAHTDELTVAFAMSGTVEEAQAEAASHELRNVLLDDELHLYNALEANGTPSALLIAPDGTIASWVASGSEAVERLVARALEPAWPIGLPVGSEAPTMRLPSLEGEALDFDYLRGRPTLLVFWNPTCGYCRAMHGDLLAWEQAAEGEEPRLVVVSSGDTETVRAEGFRSLVLLDPALTAAGSFGAAGTPTAVLVGADGRIDSPVAVGASAIFELANQHRTDPPGDLSAALSVSSANPRTD
jgi:thiol-disulfide isomerase/thioredoxin